MSIPAPPTTEPRFASIDEVTARLADTGYLASDAIATTTFLADRLGKRLEELIVARAAAAEARREAAPAPQAKASTALVLAKEKKVEEGFRNLGVRLKTVYSTATVRDRGAYGRGQAAGGRVGLERPVGSGPGVKGIGGK